MFLKTHLKIIFKMVFGRRHIVDRGGGEWTTQKDENIIKNSRKIVGERKASVDEVQGVWLFDKFEA